MPRKQTTSSATGLGDEYQLWELPSGWDWKPLRAVATVESNLVSPLEYLDSPHIAPNHIESGTGRLLPYSTIAQDGVTSPKHKFEAGVILYSKIRPYLNKVAIAPRPGLCSADMYPISTSLDVSFLHKWMLSPVFVRWASGSQGRTVLPKINQDALGRIPVPVPPLGEQRRIARRVDEMMERSWRARGALSQVSPDSYRIESALLAQAVTGLLTLSWRQNHPTVSVSPARTDGLDQTVSSDYFRPTWPIPDTWSFVPVREAGAVQLGRQRAPKYHKGDNMRPYLRTANVYEDRIDTDDVLSMEFDDRDFEAYRLQDGDILLNEGQSRELVGRPAIYRDEVPGSCFQNTLVRFRSAPDVLPEYALLVFRHYLRSGRFQQIAQWSTNIAHLGAGRFAQLEFPLPPTSEQHAIVRLFKAQAVRFTALIDETTIAQNKLRSLEQSILQRAFTGQI